MLRPIESDEPPRPSLLQALSPGPSEPIVAPVDSSEFEDSTLPRDHPKWVKDTLTVSARARAVISQLKPVAMRILGFWDHRIRSIAVGDLRVGIDPSGCYRAF